MSRHPHFYLIRLWNNQVLLNYRVGFLSDENLSVTAECWLNSLLIIHSCLLCNVHALWKISQKFVVIPVLLIQLKTPLQKVSFSWSAFWSLYGTLLFLTVRGGGEFSRVELNRKNPPIILTHAADAKKCEIPLHRKNKKIKNHLPC